MSLFGSKRGAAAVEEEDDERWAARMQTIIREENHILVDSFEKRFSAIESRQDQLESRIEEVERKLGRTPGGSGQNSITFSPAFVEVKGFCTWDERLEKGATREDADNLVKLLMPSLPAQLQQRVKPFSLRGLRNYSIKIQIEPSFIREIKGI